MRETCTVFTVLLYGMVRYGMVLYGMVWYCTDGTVACLLVQQLQGGQQATIGAVSWCTETCVRFAVWYGTEQVWYVIMVCYGIIWYGWHLAPCMLCCRAGSSPRMVLYTHVVLTYQYLKVRADIFVLSSSPVSVQVTHRQRQSTSVPV